MLREFAVETAKRKYYAEQFEEGMAWGCTDGNAIHPHCLGLVAVFGRKADRDEWVSSLDRPVGAKRGAINASHARKHGCVFVNGETYHMAF